ASRLGAYPGPTARAAECLARGRKPPGVARPDPPVSFHAEVLAKAQEKARRKLAPIMVQREFYLAGGTSLALHLGHRRSVDLDWFTGARIDDPMRLAQEVRSEGAPFVTDFVERGTLYGSVFTVRASALEYRYPLL